MFDDDGESDYCYYDDEMIAVWQEQIIGTW
jgi:hypothetical protein